MKRNGTWLVLYLAGWALAEWSLHKLTSPTLPAYEDLYGPTSVQPEPAVPGCQHCGKPRRIDCVGCGEQTCMGCLCACARDAEPAAAGDG